MRPGLILRRNSRLLVLLLIFFSTVGAYMVSRVVLKGEQFERSARFEGAAGNSALAFDRVMEKTETVIRSIISFYDSSDQVTRTDFRNFVSDALERNPAIEALTWLPQVAHRDREGFVARLRAQGLSEFNIYQRGAGDRMVKADIRPFYYPMTYAEPWRANAGSLGFDVGSDPQRLAIIEQAASNNSWVATPRVMLTHGIVQEPSIFLFAPIYGVRGPEVNKLQFPETRLQGFTLVVLNLDRLMAAAFDKMNFEKNFGLYLYDISDEAAGNLLSSWGSADTVQTNARLSELAGQKISKRFEFGGREWALVAVDKAVTSGAGLALVVFYALIVFAAVMAIALGVELTRAETIRQQVEERTTELERQRTQLEQIVTDRTAIIEEQALELQQALQQEKQLNETQKNCVAVTSKALRSPLAIIEVAAQKLERGAGKLTRADALARAEKIKLAVNRMEMLLDSALVSSKIDNGSYSFEPSLCNISLLVKACVARQNETVLLPRVRFDPPPLAEQVYIDTVAIERVVSHLISAAIDNSDSGSDILVELTSSDDDISISITAPDYQTETVEVPFADGGTHSIWVADDEAGGGREGGEPGLTLTQCKFLVELHGGSLKARSRKGEFGRFVIRLPMRAADGKTEQVA